MGVVHAYAAVPASVPVARRAIERFAQEAGADEAMLGSIRLAVTEACTNAVVHAYVGAAEPGTFTVSAEVLDDEEPRMLRIVVTDEGRGMVPRLDSPGIGFGLPIIAQVAEVFELRSAHDTGGTEVCMRFSLSAVAAP